MGAWSARYWKIGVGEGLDVCDAVCSFDQSVPSTRSTGDEWQIKMRINGFSLGFFSVWILIVLWHCVPFCSVWWLGWGNRTSKFMHACVYSTSIYFSQSSKWFDAEFRKHGLIWFSYTCISFVSLDTRRDINAISRSRLCTPHTRRDVSHSGCMIYLRDDGWGV